MKPFHFLVNLQSFSRTKYHLESENIQWGQKGQNHSRDHYHGGQGFSNSGDYTGDADPLLT